MGRAGEICARQRCRHIGGYAAITKRPRKHFLFAQQAADLDDFVVVDAVCKVTESTLDENKQTARLRLAEFDPFPSPFFLLDQRSLFDEEDLDYTSVIGEDVETGQVRTDYGRSGLAEQRLMKRKLKSL